MKADLSLTVYTTMQMVADGLTTKQVAQARFMTVTSVQNHFKRARKVYGASSTLGAIIEGVRRGTISLDLDEPRIYSYEASCDHCSHRVGPFNTQKKARAVSGIWFHSQSHGSESTFTIQGSSLTL